MYIPITPFVAHINIVNKEILYDDILQDKEFGIKTTSISNVEEYELESCIKTIFETNPNVLYDTIQYSKTNKTVYFYTNKEISKKIWENKNVNKHKTLNSTFEILDELKNVLIDEKIKDTHSISIYDISNVISNINKKYYETISDYEIILNNIVSSFDSSSNLTFCSFNHINNELSISFNEQLIIISKKEKLYIVKSELENDKEFLDALGDALTQFYNEMVKYSSYRSESSLRISPINSRFFINIGSFGVDVFTKCSNENDDFNLLSNNNKEYKYSGNFNIIDCIKGNEDEFFKNIFVKIDDCPTWIQNILYTIRQEQLMNEQKIEDEKIYKDIKKQKRLNLKKKFLPFLK